MALGHEKLDVNRLAIGYVAWVFEYSGKWNGVHRHAQEQCFGLANSVQAESPAYRIDFDPDGTHSQQAGLKPTLINVPFGPALFCHGL